MAYTDPYAQAAANISKMWAQVPVQLANIYSAWDTNQREQYDSARRDLENNRNSIEDALLQNPELLETDYGERAVEYVERIDEVLADDVSDANFINLFKEVENIKGLASGLGGKASGIRFGLAEGALDLAEEQEKLAAAEQVYANIQNRNSVFLDNALAVPESQRNAALVSAIEQANQLEVEMQNILLNGAQPGDLERINEINNTVRNAARTYGMNEVEIQADQNFVDALVQRVNSSTNPLEREMLLNEGLTLRPDIANNPYFQGQVSTLQDLTNLDASNPYSMRALALNQAQQAIEIGSVGFLDEGVGSIPLVATMLNMTDPETVTIEELEEEFASRRTDADRQDALASYSQNRSNLQRLGSSFMTVGAFNNALESDPMLREALTDSDVATVRSEIERNVIARDAEESRQFIEQTLPMLAQSGTMSPKEIEALRPQVQEALGSMFPPGTEMHEALTNAVIGSAVSDIPIEADPAYQAWTLSATRMGLDAGATVDDVSDRLKTLRDQRDDIIEEAEINGCFGGGGDGDVQTVQLGSGESRAIDREAFARNCGGQFSNFVNVQGDINRANLQFEVVSGRGQRYSGEGLDRMFDVAGPDNLMTLVNTNVGNFQTFYQKVNSGEFTVNGATDRAAVDEFFAPLRGEVTNEQEIAAETEIQKNQRELVTLANPDLESAEPSVIEREFNILTEDLSGVTAGTNVDVVLSVPGGGKRVNPNADMDAVGVLAGVTSELGEGGTTRLLDEYAADYGMTREDVVGQLLRDGSFRTPGGRRISLERVSEELDVALNEVDGDVATEFENKLEPFGLTTNDFKRDLTTLRELDAAFNLATGNPQQQKAFRTQAREIAQKYGYDGGFFEGAQPISTYSDFMQDFAGEAGMTRFGDVPQQDWFDARERLLDKNIMSTEFNTDYDRVMLLRREWQDALEANDAAKSMQARQDITNLMVKYGIARSGTLPDVLETIEKFTNIYGPIRR